MDAIYIIIHVWLKQIFIQWKISIASYIIITLIDSQTKQSMTEMVLSDFRFIIFIRTPTMPSCVLSLSQMDPNQTFKFFTIKKKFVQCILTFSTLLITVFSIPYVWNFFFFKSLDILYCFWKVSDICIMMYNGIHYPDRQFKRLDDTMKYWSPLKFFSQFKNCWHTADPLQKLFTNTLVLYCNVLHIQHHECMMRGAGYWMWCMRSGVAMISEHMSERRLSCRSVYHSSVILSALHIPTIIF